MIEAALVLPVLLVLIFGAADLALFLWQQNSAQKAVQLGARKAIVSMPVADGPGLTPAESTAYWNDLPLGQRCAPERDRKSICPIFTVTCSIRERCICPGFVRCNFLLVDARLAPIREAMRAILPQLRADQIEVSYAMNYLGYVGRPVPVPVNVQVKILDLRYDFLFLGNLLGSSLAIGASATMPSENMSTDDRD
ncbi:TadE/TadG family type IV pilus assembly protein [Bosea sp. PAMC 26642]|uniref:TadE/TadG family type IV pilus assembly protein n=1 Tax=Bosea sp. (strain PAMC 26642) TaxID=1792307 RepID=UPI00076FE4E3|nr:TadE/TadG family type IV pilus assembly protein [Bosea sp. PAMC 26642]AMJ62710.1 hypothetical protein AXW83_22565 [Bosea sp. PAMC 26642]